MRKQLLALLASVSVGPWAAAQPVDIHPAFVKAGSKLGFDDHAERAIKDGFQWQLKQQKQIGEWSPAKGQEIQGTGLGVLTLLGAGQMTKGASPAALHAKALERAVARLAMLQRADGSFMKGDFRQDVMASLALCEANGSAAVRAPAQRAVDFIVKNQRADGGWSSEVAAASDLEMSAWCVLAIKAAESRELKVAGTALPAFAKFLDSLETENGTRYAPSKGAAASARATAMGLALRCCLDEANKPAVVKGLEQLRKLGIPENIDSLQLLFIAIALKKANRPDEFKDWYVELRKQLPHIQEVQGNWLPDKVEEADGTMLVTFYRLLALESCLTTPTGQAGLSFFRQ